MKDDMHIHNRANRLPTDDSDDCIQDTRGET